MFATRLRMLRKAKNVSQEKLAAEIGVERSSIGKYEGKQAVMPSDDVKCKIADYFQVSVDYLLGRTDNPHEKQASDITHVAVTDSEIRLLSTYRSLSNEGRYEVDLFLKYALERYKKDHHVSHMETR